MACIVGRETLTVITVANASINGNTLSEQDAITRAKQELRNDDKPWRWQLETTERISDHRVDVVFRYI